MLNISLSFIFTFMVANMLMSLCLMISKKMTSNRNKYSPFECGFDQTSSSRLPFSLRFFLITIIFLIFDVEIALIIPTIPNLLTFKLSLWFNMNFTFLTILILSVLHEWHQGTLAWSV